ncbi:MAG TPA: hypothetical protein VMU51_36900 [Mycobacteriales bacterium]|nr:hypothetical protein [Mycobacteriales bacterium]
MTNDKVGTGPRRSPWLVLLLVVGVLLSTGAAALIALAATGVFPAWTLGLLSVGIWGPLSVAAWVVLTRQANRVRRIHTNGTPVRATVTEIRQTASRIGGRSVLRIELSFRLPSRGECHAWIRTAPPYHLVSMLRPRVELPALVDPADPEHPMLDWAAAERETSPA